MIELPEALVRHIADSEIEVLSWVPVRDEMVLRVSKGSGLGTGTPWLSGVDFVESRPTFTAVAVAAYDRAFSDYPNLELDEGQTALAF